MKLAIVPTLGVLALVSSAANAQEVAKGLFLDGWADNIGTYTTQENAAGGGSSLATEKTDLVDFSANAKLKVSWKPTDKITGFVGVRFNNAAARNPVSGQDPVYVQESYAAVNVGSDLTWTMGKYISHIGYVSAEPTGLYRVNGSTISGLLYTNDVTGTNLAWAPKDVPFSGSFHIVNGYFNGADQYNDTATTSGAKRSDLGLGLDLIYTLPDSKGFINLEFAWDPSSSAPVAGKKPSDIFLAGLNGEFNATDKLKFGSEFIYKASKNADMDDAGKPVDKADVEFLALVNYKLPTTMPASSTLMYQQLNTNFGTKSGVSSPVTHEISAAILTNPFGSDKLGINGEIAYAFVDGDNKSNVLDGQTVISLEALVVIP